MNQLLKNQRAKTSFLVLILLLLFSSCSNEDYYTDGERIGKELQTIIDENDIEWVEKRRVENPNPTWHTSYKNFNITGNSIFIDDEYYNLNYLTSYFTEEFTPNKPNSQATLRLVLIFEY